MRWHDVVFFQDQTVTFIRTISEDGRSATYRFGEFIYGGTTITPGLIDSAIVESEKQASEIGLPGVLEVTTPAGRILRVPIQPAPMCEIVSPPRHAPSTDELMAEIGRLLYPSTLRRLLDSIDPGKTRCRK